MGEGWGGGQGRHDRLQHTLSIADHVMIPEAQHRPARSPQERVARFVRTVRVMLSAIDLDDEPGGNAREIGEARRNRVLATKVPAKLPRAQTVPQVLFGIR